MSIFGLFVLNWMRLVNWKTKHVKSHKQNEIRDSFTVSIHTIFYFWETLRLRAPTIEILSLSKISMNESSVDMKPADQVRTHECTRCYEFCQNATQSTAYTDDVCMLPVPRKLPSCYYVKTCLLQ